MSDWNKTWCGSRYWPCDNDSGFVVVVCGKMGGKIKKIVRLEKQIYVVVDTDPPNYDNGFVGIVCGKLFDNNNWGKKCNKCNNKKMKQKH